MKTKDFFILPSIAKYVGYILIIISIVLAIVLLMKEKSFADFFQNLDLKTNGVYVALLVGLSLITFTKQKNENNELQLKRNKSLIYTLIVSVVYFLVFSFVNITLPLTTIPAIIFMDMFLLIYLLVFTFSENE
jgi:glucose uptake protein GlcU